MALRTGYAIPFGKVSGERSFDGAADDEMSDFVSGQVPLFVEVGAKIIPNLFVGGYFGLGFGGSAGKTGDLCDTPDTTCVGVGFRLGIEAQYAFIPQGPVNPWIGYGLGIESVALGMSTDGSSSSFGYGGFEYARFSGGADFRLNRVFGMGPFIDVALGTYTSYSYDPDSGPKLSGDLDEKAMHGWITIGARFVFFP